MLLFFTISSIAEVVEVKKNDTIIEKSTSNVTEAVDLDGKDAETNSTIVEVQNDNNKTLNVSSLDESLNSQSETSEDNVS